MSGIRRLITAGGTLLCALGIGYFMQAGERPPRAADAPSGQAEDAEKGGSGAAGDTSGAVVLTDVTLTSAVPVPPGPVPQPAVLPTLPEAMIQPAAFDADTRAELPEEAPVPAFECETTLTAETLAAAMVELSLDAPCMINERFTLHHNGMMITGVTDATGQSELTVPALSKQAVFIVSFAAGQGAVATAEVTSMEYYDRVVLQWQGPAGLQLHALEFGASYGEEGHVWSDAARSMGVAARGEGGFHTRLGALDQPEARLAEVYTFPSGTARRGGNVAVSVEAEVTEDNCTRDIAAQTIEVRGAGRPRVKDLELAMPECDAAGDFLVLKNLLNDLKIAGQ
ncbi:hypothetical protein [Roseovarius sp. SYSU LYC5161]|uniref:hypothetical protein n=1 Tax=Roseovarius halophilus (ex Wu et al. 2025) TaxID=3376060 RepID=UPI00399BF213